MRLVGEDLRRLRGAQVNGQPLDARGRKLLPLKPIDGREQKSPAARQLLAGLLPAARVNDGREIVDAEVLLNEAPGRLTHEQGPRRRGVQIVQQQDVDAAVEGAGRRPHVGLDGG